MSAMRGVIRTVRFRITILASVVVTLVLGAVGATLLVVQQRQLGQSLDDSLQRRADTLVVGGVTMGDAPTVLPNPAGDEVVIQVVSVNGEVIAGTENALGIEPIAAAPGSERDEFATVPALPVEDDAYRVLSRATVIDGDAVVLHVAESTDDVQELLDRLRVAVAVTIPVAVAVLAALTWWLVGRTIRPVERIRAEVAGFGPAQLDRRVSSPGTGDEIDRLAVTMNEMLDRLEDATRREQRFVADASHELRSPLTRIRTELETMGAEAGAGIDGAVKSSVLDEINELTALVDDLLVLARSDAGDMPPERRPVDLDDVVFDEVGAARATAAGVTIDVSGVSAAEVLGSPGELRRVVRNLLDNAVRHASSRVAVTLAEDAVDSDDARAILTITDDGLGIPPEQTSAVFERFTRLDDARTRQSGGTGLGLAIARDIVERHGGTLRLDGAHRPGARFEVRLPATVTRS
jgi:signal transduction histidine kinase